MSFPPLHNLRLGSSTGVSLTFSKKKKDSDDYNSDNVTSAKIDDYIDKGAALKELDKLITKLTEDAPFLMQWRLSICDNMTQKLSYYNGQTEGILDEIFKEQKLLLRLVDAFRRPVELVKGKERDLTNEDMKRLKREGNPLWDKIKATIPRYLDLDGGYDIKDEGKADTPLSRSDRLQNTALMDMNESKHSMLGDSTKRFKMLNMKVEAIKKLTDEIEKRVEVIAYNQKWAQASADFINSLKELKDYPEQAGMIEKIVNVVNSFIQTPSVSAHQFNNVMIMGGAGTGKTRLAGILGRIFSQLGMYVYDEVVEASVGDFIAGFEGQTEEKVVTFLTTNAEKIIFLDEAYALTKWDDKHEHLSGYATEAVAELIAFLSKNVGRMGFVAAGYEDKMNDDFLEANEGFERRFPIRVTLQRYENKTLFHIFIRSLALSFVGPEPSATERGDRSRWKKKLHEQTTQCYTWFMDESVHLLFDVLDASIIKKPGSVQDNHKSQDAQLAASSQPSQSNTPLVPHADQLPENDSGGDSVAEAMSIGSPFSGGLYVQAPMFQSHSVLQISADADDAQSSNQEASDSKRDSRNKLANAKLEAYTQLYEKDLGTVPDELKQLIKEKIQKEIMLKESREDGSLTQQQQLKMKSDITKLEKHLEVFVLTAKVKQLEKLQAKYLATQMASVQELEKMKQYLKKKLDQMEEWEYNKLEYKQYADEEYRFPYLSHLFQAQAGAMTNLAGVAAALLLSNANVQQLLDGQLHVDRRSMFNMILTWMHSTYTSKAHSDKNGREYEREIARDEMIVALKETSWISEENKWNVVPADKRKFTPPISANDYVTTDMMLKQVMETFTPEYIPLRSDGPGTKKGTFCQQFQRKMKEYHLIEQHTKYLGDELIMIDKKRGLEGTRQSGRQRVKTEDGAKQEQNEQDEPEISVEESRLAQQRFPVTYEASDGQTYSFWSNERNVVHVKERQAFAKKYIDEKLAKALRNDVQRTPDKIRKMTQSFLSEFNGQFDATKGELAEERAHFLKMKREWRESEQERISNRPRRGGGS